MLHFISKSPHVWVLPTWYSHIHLFLHLCLFSVVRPLGPENLLLRGARLKNTKEIFGESMLMQSKEMSLRQQNLCLRGKLLWGYIWSFCVKSIDKFRDRKEGRKKMLKFACKKLDRVETLQRSSCNTDRPNSDDIMGSTDCSLSSKWSDYINTKLLLCSESLEALWLQYVQMFHHFVCLWIQLYQSLDMNKCYNCAILNVCEFVRKWIV